MKPGILTVRATPQGAERTDPGKRAEHRGATRSTLLGEQAHQHVVERRLVEAPVDLAVMGDADQSGLFAHDQHHRVALHGQAERGAVSRAHATNTGQRLGERQHAARRDDPAFANDHRAVVER